MCAHTSCLNSTWHNLVTGTSQAEIIHPPLLLGPLSCPLYVGHPVSLAASSAWILEEPEGSPPSSPFYPGVSFSCWGAEFGASVALLCVWVRMPALLQLHRDDCSSAARIAWAAMEGERTCVVGWLRGGMMQAWGLTFSLQAAETSLQKGGVEVREWFTTFSLLGTGPTCYCRGTEKARNYFCFGGFLPGWRISGGVGGN